MALGKHFNCLLPRLEKYPNRMCWLHAIAIYLYGDECTITAGHIEQGNITDAHADKVVGAMQQGVTAIMTRNELPSPTGK